MKVGQYPDLVVNIYIAADRQEYHFLTSNDSAILEFSQAFYSSYRDTIYIRNPRDLQKYNSLSKILIHEYIHIFVDHYIEDPPLWFNEGMAVYFSNDLSIDREFNFIINYIMGNSRELREMIHYYPENRIEWESFYAKAALAVKYLYQKKRNQFYHFWELATREDNFRSIFVKSFHLTPLDFSQKFEEYSKSHFKMEILLASTGLIWSILPLILILGMIRKTIKNRKIKKQWEREEVLVQNIKQDEV